jgi:hypothetical protein
LQANPQPPVLRRSSGQVVASFSSNRKQRPAKHQQDARS